MPDEEISLDGWGSYDAAVYCASICAGERLASSNSKALNSDPQYIELPGLDAPASVQAGERSLEDEATSDVLMSRRLLLSMCAPTAILFNIPCEVCFILL